MITTKKLLVVYARAVDTLLLRQHFDSAGAELPLFAGDERSIAFAVTSEETPDQAEARFRDVIVGALGVAGAAAVELRLVSHEAPPL